MAMAATVHAEELAALPQMDTGAPLPLVVADEHAVALSYCPLDSDEYALVIFRGARHHSSGSPSDETFHGHALYGSGIERYGAFVIHGSPLIDALAKIDSVHPRHAAEKFENLNHYLFAFHDSTFECVAQSFEVSMERYVEGDKTANPRLLRMVQCIQQKHSNGGGL